MHRRGAGLSSFQVILKGAGSISSRTIIPSLWIVELSLTATTYDTLYPGDE